MTTPHFDRTFRGQPDEPFSVAAGITRLTANNPGPMTFVGTNSYIIGEDSLVVIDPGPADDAHLQALVKTIDGRSVEAILVTHSHNDHSPLARPLSRLTGAPILGAKPHDLARSIRPGDISLDAAIDHDHMPHESLSDGQMLTLGDQLIEVVATPGHTMNHLCFALPERGILFSGDHVMAWSTSLVAPPEGSMSAYLASLQVLLNRPETIYLTGHGASLRDAKLYVEALYSHRMDREAALLQALECDRLSARELVDRLYEGLDQSLRLAASLSVLAHLERLKDLGQVVLSSEPDMGEPIWTAARVAYDSDMP